jgi:hypothetical protein
MRQIGHIMWRIATVASLVLFVVAVALWVRSQWAFGYVFVGRASPPTVRFVGILCYTGSVELGLKWVELDSSDSRYPRVSAGWDVVGRNRPPEPLEVDAGPKDTDAWERGWGRWGFAFQLYSISPRGWVIPWRGDNYYLNKTFNVWVAAPWWFVTLATAVLPARATHQWRRGRRAKRGGCANCGYDLRATPERCPECGAAVARTTV